MKQEDYELLRDFDKAENTLRKAQELYNAIKERVCKSGLISFEEFFKPYVGKCFRKGNKNVPSTETYIKILRHLYLDYFEVIRVNYDGLYTEKIRLHDFPESYDEISLDKFAYRAEKWFEEQMLQ